MGNAMELLQLTYFLEVAESEHVTNSAKKLRIAQPALTQSIHRLERELGVSLFEHVGRNIRLTPAGAYLKGRLAPTLESLNSIAHDLEAFSEEEKHTVRIDIQSASGIVVDAIAQYSTSNPTTRFRVSQNAREPFCDLHVTTLMPDGTYHGSSTAGGIEVAWEQTAQFVERIGLAISEQSAQDIFELPPSSESTAQLHLTSLATKRFISLAGSRAFRALCDTLCDQTGFSPLVAFESDSPSVVKKMIGLGLGVGFWPEHSWGRLAGNGVRFAKLSDENFKRTIVVLRASNTLSPEAVQFHAFLLNYIEGTWNKVPKQR